MFKHSIVATINKQRPDKNGLFPVRIRVIINRITTFHPTGVMIAAEFWDPAAREITRHPKKTYYNAAIRKRMAEIEQTILEQKAAGTLTGRIEKKRELLFSTYAAEQLKKTAKVDSEETGDKKFYTIEKFNRFRPKLLLKQVNTKLLNEYEDYCRSLGNTGNTICANMNVVLSIINAGIREKVIAADNVADYKRPPYKNPPRTYLTADEIKRLESFVTTCQEAQFKDAANWFLFSCYSGLRYGDVKAFEQSRIVNDKLIFRTSKMETDVTIKLHARLRVCIGRMNYQVPSNQDYNRKLKAIALLCKIDKPLTSHIARHTFSVQFLEGGGSMAVLSKLLGHTNIKTTQIYGNITDKLIDDEMRNVWGD